MSTYSTTKVHPGDHLVHFFDDDDQLRAEVMDRHRPQLRSLLESLDGRVQMTLKAIYHEDVLLREVPPPAGEKTLLDLGCGWGAIAVGLALAAPDATVWAVDVNSRARELTAENAMRHRTRGRVAAPDAVPGELLFDEIWSNPPVRIGKDALHGLLAMWMARLAPDGSAYLVVGKNLGADTLQRWLIDSGFPTERIASSRGFRVLRVTARQ